MSLSFVLVAACSIFNSTGETAEPDKSREAAIKAIEKLGGKVGYDDKKKEVVRVDLNRSQVTDADLGHLKGFTELQVLDLYDTMIGDAGLEHLKGLTKLRFLMLKQTNATQAGVKKLEKALPNCETISYSPRTPAPPAIFLPVGKWSVAFANGVKQTCEIRADGTASVVEPLRTSGGKATAVKGGAVVVVFEDDVVERWTPVGKRYVVQFWVSGSQFPTATPLLGIAERAP